MLKKLAAVLITAVMTLSNITAFCEADVSAYTLTLDDAIDMALKYSPELECWEVNQENCQIQLADAKRAKKDNKNVPVYASQNFELTFVKNGYYVKAAESQIRLSKIEKNKIINTISYNVTQKYYTVKNAAKMCEIANSALARANENRSVTQKQFDMGACTKLELENADIAILQCQTNAEKAKNSYELAVESLKILLGIDGECTVNLTDEISVMPFDANVEADTKAALETRYDVNALRESADLAVEYFKTASTLNSKSTTYFSAYTNNIKSKHNFNSGVKNIGLLIKSAYYSVSEAKSNTEIARKKYEYLQDTYDVNKLRYEMGMITGIMLSASSDELASAESSYQNALLTEKLAIEKYYYEIDTGI